MKNRIEEMKANFLEEREAKLNAWATNIVEKVLDCMQRFIDGQQVDETKVVEGIYTIHIKLDKEELRELYEIFYCGPLAEATKEVFESFLNHLKEAIATVSDGCLPFKLNATGKGLEYSITVALDDFFNKVTIDTITYDD